MKSKTLTSRSVVAIIAFLSATVIFWWGRLNLNTIEEIGVNVFRIVENPNSSPAVIFYDWLLYTSPYSRIFEFILGCSLAHLFNKMSEKTTTERERLWANIIASLSLLNILLLFSGLHELFPLISKHIIATGFTPSLAVIILYFARYENIFTNILTSRFILKMGDSSYSMYLLHIIIIQKSAVPAGVSGTYENIFLLWMRFIIIIIAVLLISVGSYSVFEIPSRNYIRKMLTVKK